MKYVLVIGDGMADTRLPQLAGKTPLEALALPAFDRCLFRPVSGSTPEMRTGWLGEVASMVSAYFPKKR